MSSTTAGYAAGLSRTVSARVRRRDVALIAVVPVLLGAVFLLPASVRRSLAFEHSEPTVLTAYTSAFVHFGDTHLLVNVIGYAVVVPVAYALSLLSGARERFVVVFATFLLAFPFALAGLNLLFVRPTLGAGFSGVLMAFVGYLPLAIATYADEQFGIGPRRYVAPALFFVGLALVVVLGLRAALSNPTVLLGTSGLFVATVLAAALFAVAAVDGRDQLAVPIRTVVRTPGHLETLAVASVVFVGFPFVAFPPNPTAAGATVNTYLHLLGYALGFMVTYSSVEISERLSTFRTGL